MDRGRDRGVGMVVGADGSGTGDRKEPSFGIAGLGGRFFVGVGRERER